jgi:hypothetical protein
LLRRRTVLDREVHATVADRAYRWRTWSKLSPGNH